MKLSKSLFITLLTVLFFLSGLAGLIYESIWSHYLKLFVGHAAYARTLVLVIYMGGMALGSWLAARFSPKIRNLLAGYAVVEIIIGSTALVFHPVFVQYCNFSYDTVLPALHSPMLISLYKWIAASLLILPQTILLGATFPLMTSGVIRASSRTPGRTISLFYFVNSLGGAVGVLLSGFYLIGKLAFAGTVICAGVIDIIVGAGVLLLRYFNRDADVKAGDKKTAETSVGIVPSGNLDKVGAVMLLVAGVTAACSFIYEVGWIRMLSLVLGSSTYSFELMLSAFIFGLAIGGFWIRKRLDGIRNPTTYLAVVQAVMGFFAIGTVVFYSNLFHLMTFFMSTLSRTDHGYIMFHIYSHLLCFILMLPATIPAGMTLPIITWFLYRRNADERAVGLVYASNTLGSIVGVLLSIHLLMPLAGLKNMLIIGGALDMGAGVFLVLWRKEPSYRRNTLVLTSMMAVMVLATLAGVRFDPSLLSSGVFRHGKIYRDDGIVYYRDGKTSSVSVRKVPHRYQLVNNGKTDASVGFDTARVTLDEYTQMLLAIYPLTYGNRWERTAVIGLGSGMTGSILLQSDSIKQLDIIEIEKYVVDAAKHMGPKVRKVFDDPRCTIHIDDAKAFFSAQREPYDCIVSEPSNPWVSGVSSLFTREFYHLAAKHLSSAGIFVQWLHLYEMSPNLIASVIKALETAFVDYRAFVCGSDMILLASDTPLKKAPVYPAERHPKLSVSLKRIGFLKEYDFRSNIIGGTKSLRGIMNTIEITPNSDFHPVLDLNAEKDRFTNASSNNFAVMNSYLIPARKIIEGDTLSGEHLFNGRTFNRRNQNTSMMAADYKAWQTWWYITSIGTGKEAEVDSAVSGDVALKVVILRMAAADSSIVTRMMMPKYIVDLLEMTMPYLPAKRMVDIWSFIDRVCADSNLPPRVKDIQNVLRQVSTNTISDATRMLSRQLLGKGEIREHEYNRMAAVAFFIASTVCGKYDGIHEVWNRLGDIRYDFNCMMAYQYACRCMLNR